MSNPSLAETWVTPPKDGRRFAAALGIGLLLEAAALGLLLPWMAHQVPPAANTPARVKLSIISPTPPAPPKPPPPVPPPPKPVVQPPPVPLPPPPPVPVAPPLPLPPPLPKPATHHIPRHIPRPPKHVVQAPVQPVQPPTPPPPAAPPPSAPAAPNTDELAQFAAAMHRALQDALIFPDGAQMAHESGVVRIRFLYQDGAVSNIIVISSCGFPELDQAAVETARVAHYPPPPPDFAGRTESVDVDVIFPAAAPSVDSD